MSTECPHGHQALDGYLLPVNLAAGAAFSPALLEAAAGVAGAQLRQMGVDLALVSAPVSYTHLDVYKRQDARFRL